MRYCLEGDTERFLSTLLDTLGMAAALAVGVILASSLFRAAFPFCSGSGMPPAGDCRKRSLRPGV